PVRLKKDRSAYYGIAISVNFYRGFREFPGRRPGAGSHIRHRGGDGNRRGNREREKGWVRRSVPHPDPARRPGGGWGLLLLVAVRRGLRSGDDAGDVRILAGCGLRVRRAADLGFLAPCRLLVPLFDLRALARGFVLRGSGSV